MPASNLIEHVAQLVETGASLVDDQRRPELDAVARRLREPVRVAVVGRVNSGKSTMVNALLGQRVAPTDVSECTRLVCWFRYGLPQRVEVELVDGTTVAAQLGRDGLLPDRLPVPAERIRALHCYLANDALRNLTLIDTPGLGSVHDEFSQATTDLLSAGTTEATAHADAVVFLFNQVMMEDEYETLQLFKTGANGPDAGRSAASAVGVLSKADQLGDGSTDSWHVALDLATRYAGQFRDEVATVVPVIGLLAETAEAAGLTEGDVNHLAALAAMDDKAFRRLLWSADRFVTADAAVGTDERERLLGLLDLYGVDLAVGTLRAGAVGANALREALAQRSGVAQVKRALDRYFRDQDHVLKVRSAFTLLDRLTYPLAGQPADPRLALFRSQIEALRLDPVMHPVSELEAWHDCCTGRVDLPPGVLDELRRLFAPGTVANRLGVTDPQADRAVLAEAAKEAMVRWQRFIVTDATPGQASVARTVRRSYQLLWSGLQ